MRPRNKTTEGGERGIKEGRAATGVALLVFGVMLLATGLLDALFAIKTGTRTGPLEYAMAAGGIALIAVGKTL